MELYHHFMYFTLGALTTLLFTELAKYTTPLPLPLRAEADL